MGLGHTLTAELTIRRKQLTASMNYGLVDYSKWVEETEFFIERVVEPRAGKIKNSTKRLQAVRALIDTATASYASSRTGFSIEMDPIAYEHLVSDRLHDLGWETRLTKGSGDQGVDVIAEMREKRVVIQCKRYRSSIGNAAVQEAYAGKSFEDADYAAVVSNAKYTPAARNLADSTRVILLHHDELTQLEEQIFETESWRSLEAKVPPAAARGYIELAKREESHSRKVIVDALSIALVGVAAAILSRFLDIR
jgi:restriction system protein